MSGSKKIVRRAKKFLYVPEGSYKHFVIWYTLWMSARLTKREAEEELGHRKDMHDFTVWRIAKFRREELTEQLRLQNQSRLPKAKRMRLVRT